MDSSSSSLVTIVLDSQAFARQIEAIAHFIPVHLDSLFNLADCRLHHYRVADPAFSADDAVQDAHLKLLEAVKHGKIDSMETEEDFAKLVRHKLRQVVLHERDRESRRKRGGSRSANSGAAPAIRELDVDLEAIESHIRPPDEQGRKRGRD